MSSVPTVTVTLTAAGTTTFEFQHAGHGTWFALTVAGPAAIPAWLQAYGRASKDAPCLDGWRPSWQSWAEPVTGGWVCVRSIPSLGN